MGSSSASGTFSGSSCGVDASYGLIARVTSWCVFGHSALLPYWAVRPNSTIPSAAVTKTYRRPRYTGCPVPAVLLLLTAPVRSGAETTAMVLTLGYGRGCLRRYTGVPWVSPPQCGSTPIRRQRFRLRGDRRPASTSHSYQQWLNETETPHSESTANLLTDNGSNFAIFSECALISKEKWSDFDSAKRRFESSRPSQRS